MVKEEIHSFLRSRRSVRKFKKAPIPREVVQRILATATWAPSAHNRQPWRLIVLETQDSKQALLNAMLPRFQADMLADGLSPEEAEIRLQRSRNRIWEAPLAILLCMDPEALDRYPDPTRQSAEQTMGTQSVSLFGGTLLLAAHAEGLGAVWICAPLFAPDAVIDALKLPATWEPQGLILLGYPVENPSPRPRRDIDEVTRYL